MICEGVTGFAHAALAMSSDRGNDNMNILGISAFYHDSAAALLCNGDIVAAAQEERFSRKKHDARFPIRCETHEFVFTGIHLETSEISKGGIEHA